MRSQTPIFWGDLDFLGGFGVWGSGSGSQTKWSGLVGSGTCRSRDCGLCPWNCSSGGCALSRGTPFEEHCEVHPYLEDHGT